MILDGIVMREWKDRAYRAKSGVEVVPHVWTILETGESPMLQLVDYVLTDVELSKFGTMAQKPVRLRVTQVRSIFSGRVRMEGQLLERKA